jgi:hypothetical protein
MFHDIEEVRESLETRRSQFRVTNNIPVSGLKPMSSSKQYMMQKELEAIDKEIRDLIELN